MTDSADRLAAEMYDEVYRGRDVSRESEVARDIILARNPAARTVLDVGCGNGRHIGVLQRWFDCVGLDIDSGLLSIARERYPDIEFWEDDMVSFARAMKFDAIVSFFGTLAYARPFAKLCDAADRISAHLRPGGVAVIQPWYTPDTWPGWKLNADFVDTDEMKAARIQHSTPSTDGVDLENHYLVGKDGRVTQFVRRSSIALYSLAEYFAAFADTGLTVTWDERPDLLLLVAEQPPA